MRRTLDYASVAIVLDDLVISAPVIDAPQFGGRVRISRQFTLEDVERLATQLTLGPLPVRLEEVSVSSIPCG